MSCRSAWKLADLRWGGREGVEGKTLLAAHAVLGVELHKPRKRHGLKLSSSVSEDGVVHFSLLFAHNDELCASMDVNPMTGTLVVQPTSR